MVLEERTAMINRDLEAKGREAYEWKELLGYHLRMST